MEPDKYFQPPAPTEETAKETLRVLQQIERHLSKLADCAQSETGNVKPCIRVEDYR